jgi:MoxR-like ATPase
LNQQATEPIGHSAFTSAGDVEAALRGRGYLADHGLATAMFLALKMRRPLLLEGEAGVGKTQVAKTLADLLGSELIRLQCYEGIDAAQAIYEWDYPRQLLYSRSESQNGSNLRGELYTSDFLLERPILRAVRAGARAVLLVDELDRADDEFEAFLLEALSEYSVTVPEFGTIRAPEPPVVVITSNRTRELHDALKRRCLYHWIEYPSFEREMDIIRLHVPAASAALVESVATAVARLRELDLVKSPGVAEAIDWTVAATLIHAPALDRASADVTLGAAVKNREDVAHVRSRLVDLFDG